MCGIAGFLGSPPASDLVLAQMTDRLAHRGPDAQGVFHGEGVHLGHRRLAVIDLDSGRQPLFNEDGQIALVFNGEIYNFRELRQRLIALGHVFLTHTDSEVLIHGYEAWGTGLLDEVRGMFAFALWDGTRKRLLLARDHLGVKPLYYSFAAATGDFVFASELKALLVHPNIARQLDPEALGLYLERQYIPTPRSVYSDIKKLPAAHWISIEDGRMTMQRYWQAPYAARAQACADLDEATAIDSTLAALRESVSSMLVADVPLGVFLSGGVDSSLIAALVCEQKAAIDTFTLGFAGQVKGSEHEVAAQVAEHIGSRHHCLMLEADDVLTAFDRFVDIFDEPLADPAALPTLLLSEYARRFVTVVLTGEGADEVFAGYGNYPSRLRDEAWSSWLGGRFSPLPALIRGLPPRLRKDRLLKAISSERSRRYVTIPSVFDVELRRQIFTPAFLALHHESMADYAQMHDRECDSPDYLEHLLHIDRNLWLPDDLLCKVDRASMAHALEARVPYLDHRFVTHCCGLPPTLKVRGKHCKYLLKRMAERYLPAAIVHRNKQGFVLPLSEWLAGPLRQPVAEALQSQAHRGLLLPAAVRRLEQEHYAGRRHHAGRLWTLLVLERWLQRHAPDFSLGA